MEDEDSKVRRNLLTVSTLVLLVAWLNTPLSKVGGKFLGIENLDAQFEWRVWAAAAAMLIYFGLRHRFSPENTTAFKAMKNELSRVERDRLASWLDFEVRVFTWAKTTLLLHRTGLTEAVEKALFFGAKQGFDEPRVISIRISNSNYLITESGPNNFSLQAWFYVVDASKRTSAIEQDVRGPLARYQMLLLQLWGFVWLATYSKASTVFLVPWCLALAAAMVVIFKLLTT